MVSEALTVGLVMVGGFVVWAAIGAVWGQRERRRLRRERAGEPLGADAFVARLVAADPEVDADVARRVHDAMHGAFDPGYALHPEDRFDAWDEDDVGDWILAVCAATERDADALVWPPNAVTYRDLVLAISRTPRVR